MLRNLRIKNFKGWKDTNNRQASKLDELGELSHFFEKSDYGDEDCEGIGNNRIVRLLKLNKYGNILHFPDKTAILYT